MIQLLKKEDQYNTTIFNDNFLVNKPVVKTVGIFQKINVGPKKNSYSIIC